MKKTIYQTIEKFEPRVTVVDVRVKLTPDENSLSVDIVFKIVNTDRPVTFNTVISRVR
jgi:predicted component of type VI protein secretion system